MSDVEKNIGTHKPEFDGEWVRLGDVCAKGKSNLRQKDLKNDGPYPVYGAPGIVGFSSNYQNADAYVAVVKDGAGVGRVMACEPRSSVLGTMQALLPGKGTDRDYLLHLVRSMDLGKGFTGSTIPHIYFKDYGKTLVRALSRGRQVEVANRLSGIDRLISQGKQQLSFLDDLVKSQFVEMFGDPVANEMGWAISTVKDSATVYGDGPFGSNLKSSDYVDEGVRVIRLGNIAQGHFSEKDRSFISFEKFETLKKFECRPGEVVIATLGDPILRACLVPKLPVPSIHKADCMYYQVDRSKLLPIFAMCAINHPSMLRRAQGDTHGQTRGRINSTQTGNLPMVLPPLALQQQFADFVARVDKLGFDVQQQIEKLETLKQSLMQEYFG